MLYKVFYLLIIYSTIISCQDLCNSNDYLSKDHKQVKCLIIPNCAIKSAIFTDLDLVIGEEKSAQISVISICHNDNYLYFEFENYNDSSILSKNANKEKFCDTSSQIFISYGKEDPLEYYNILINPFNTLLINKIDQTQTYKPIPEINTNIYHGSTPNQHNQKWRATVDIPLSFLTNINEISQPIVLRTNILRIIKSNVYNLIILFIRMMIRSVTKTVASIIYGVEN